MSKTLIKTITAINPFPKTMKAGKSFTLFPFLQYFPPDNICMTDRISQQETALTEGINNRGRQEVSEALGFINGISLNRITWTLLLTLQVYFLTVKEIFNFDCLK